MALIEETEFRVTRSHETVVTTVSYLMIMVAFIIIADVRMETPTWLFYFFVGVMVIIGLTVFCLTPRSIALSQDALIVRRNLSPKTIPYASIRKVQPVAIEYGKHIGLMSARGLFGNLGWFYSRDTGVYFAYTASRRDGVMVTLTNGKKYMLSCDSRDLLLRELNQRMKGVGR